MNHFTNWSSFELLFIELITGSFLIGTEEQIFKNKVYGGVSIYCQGAMEVKFNFRPTQGN